MSMEFEKGLSVQETGIEGLKVLELSVHGDSRGWFKENWQRAKMVALGIPDLHVVQNNISFNAERGVTCGIHAEPWDKFISVAAGSVFGTWVDLRAGSPTYGKACTCIFDPSRAIYVPRGVGNSFQALEDGTVYTYLVDAHWSAELKRTYTFVNLADPALGIEWPIPLSEATLSEADRRHPYLKDVVPMAPKRTLVTGCRGQLGRAVRSLAEERGLVGAFDFCDIDTFDFSDPDAYGQYDWDLYGTVINCGAWTAVDAAEAPRGQDLLLEGEYPGPGAPRPHLRGVRHRARPHIVRLCLRWHQGAPHGGGTLQSPLRIWPVQGRGRPRRGWAPRILHPALFLGDRRRGNFVKTMAKLSDRVADSGDVLSLVKVVDDQTGRFTFTRDMAAAIFHLLHGHASFGTYNCTGIGAARSWAYIAKTIFELANGNGDKVVPVSTAEYYASAKGPCRSEAGSFRARPTQAELYRLRYV